ncbi:uncharacterized protein BP5553_01035 [Venustampulla echinocandica]|uniref:Uncharacterized protein n=1 Tax=Venustampulla echinocandica TaxID=2656787 RepID=A0A370TZV0_9HELO|nr:uncharacterized protein BP5553_01035 [Venustampulla echinocandica]RDL41056.1 hypothetical protein BP5553_01035 [Venustampulla echinocandica]
MFPPLHLSKTDLQYPRTKDQRGAFRPSSHGDVLRQRRRERQAGLDKGAPLDWALNMDIIVTEYYEGLDITLDEGVEQKDKRVRDLFATLPREPRRDLLKRGILESLLLDTDARQRTTSKRRKGASWGSPGPKAANTTAKYQAPSTKDEAHIPALANHSTRDPLQEMLTRGYDRGVPVSPFLRIRKRHSHTPAAWQHGSRHGMALLPRPGSTAPEKPPRFNLPVKTDGRDGADGAPPTKKLERWSDTTQRPLRANCEALDFGLHQRLRMYSNTPKCVSAAVPPLGGAATYNLRIPIHVRPAAQPSKPPDDILHLQTTPATL